MAWYRSCSQCLPIYRQSREYNQKIKGQDAFSKGSVIKNGKGQDSPSNGHVMPWNNSGSWRKGFQTLGTASLSILCLQSPKVMPFHGKGHMDQEKSQRHIACEISQVKWWQTRWSSEMQKGSARRGQMTTRSTEPTQAKP